MATAQTDDGLAIDTLYTEANLPPTLLGIPGGPPFIRGASAVGSVLDGWDVRSLVSLPSIEAAKAAWSADLQLGATSIHLELGADATPVSSAAELTDLLDGFDLEGAGIALQCAPHSLPAAASLLAIAQSRGQLNALRGTLGVDPLGQLARTGSLPMPLEEALGWVPELVAYCSKNTRHVRALSIDVGVYYEAGMSECWAAATGLSAAVEYLNASDAAGLIPDMTARQLQFSLRLGPKPFHNMALLRALRRCWARVLEACDGRAVHFIHARGSLRGLSALDPEVNLLRETAMALGAALGGADAITTIPYDSAAGGVPSPEARRLATTTQTILLHEAHLGRVLDPAGGSYFLEALTEQMAQEIWSNFQRLEANGGLATSLRAGTLHAIAERAHEARADRVATRRQPLLGASEYPQLGPALSAQAMHASAEPEPIAANLDALTDAVERLWSDHPAKVGTAMGALVDAAASANWPALSDALAADAEQGEALLTHRLAEPFEAYRRAAEQVRAEQGAYNPIFLATLGPLAEHTARLGFITHLCAAGGLRAVVSPEQAAPERLVHAFLSSGAGVAVLCGSDKRYAAEAVDAAKALVAAGAEVWLAGKPGVLAEPLTGAGFSGHVALGTDVLAVLDAWTQAPIRSHKAE